MKEDFDYLGVFFTIFILMLIVIASILTIRRYRNINESYDNSKDLDLSNISDNPDKLKNAPQLPLNIPYGQNGYTTYSSNCAPATEYHRYQANLCDRTQDVLPITLPDPNEGQDRPIMDDMKYNVFYQGSLPCNQMGSYWLCS